MSMRWKRLNSPDWCVCVLGISLVFSAGRADAESFLSVIKRLVLTQSGSDIPASYSAAGNVYERELDWVSKKCVECHNGMEASNITTSSVRILQEYPGQRSQRHPVGVDYERYVRVLPSEYRPMAVLTRDIDFVNGKVSCVSCHRSDTDYSKMLSVPGNQRDVEVDCPSSGQLNSGPGGSGLCQACHRI